ncbi:MAG TPA: energy transducer TonB [Opitutaceae bacterium]|nr:energy transducer TonB [Opitutaceae bacterium]
MKHLTALLSLGCLLAAIPAAHAETKEPPIAVRTVPPVYPDEMQRQGIAGIVTIKCTIDEHGDVTDAVVVKASAEVFQRPAVEALQRWKFKPAKLDGKAVSTKALIPIKFVINS